MGCFAFQKNPEKIIACVKPLWFRPFKR